MLTNGIPGECATTVAAPNIHDILVALDTVLSETNEQADRIRNFLRSQPMKKSEKEPGGAIDMLSHVTDINEKAMALHDQIAEITQILGM